jgi:MFS family permease
MRIGRYAGILALNGFSQGLLISVLSLVMLDKGIALGQIALAMGAYSVTAALLEVPSGVAADRFGKKSTFIFAQLIAAAAFGPLLFLRGAGWVFAAAALAGAGRAMASGTIEALFVSRHNAAFGEERLPKAMRVLALTESLGLAGGALAGGFIPALSGRLLPGMGAYDLNLLLRVATCLLLAALTALRIPSDHAERSERQPLFAHIRDHLGVIRKSRSLKWLLISAAGLGVMLCALESYWQPLFLGLLGGAEKTGMLGVLSVLFLGSITAGNLISEKLVCKHKAGEKAIFLGARALMLACMVCAALAASPALFMAAYCLMYFCLGAANIPEGAMIHREVPDGSRASMLSVQSFTLQAGALATSAGSAAVIGAFSINVLWLFAAGAAALLLTPALRIAGRKKPAAEPLEK